MSRTRKFLGGAGLGYLNQGVTVLVGVWVTRFLLGRLGANEYGLWLVALQILAYLTLADVGVVALVPRETAYGTGRGQTDGGAGVRLVTGQAIRLVFWQLPLVAIAALVVWVWLPESWASLRSALATVLVAFVALFPLRVVPAVLQGLQDLAFVGWAQLASWAATTVTSVGLVLAGERLSALAIGWLVGQALMTSLCLVRLLVRFRSAVPARLPPLNWAAAKGYLKKSVWMSIGQLAQVLLVGSDVLIIGAVLGPAAVVPYVCTCKLVSVFRNQPLLLIQVALPGLSEIRVSESRERFFDVTQALTQGALILSGAAACTILLTNRWFVGWWVGMENYSGFFLTIAVVAAMLARHLLGSLAVSVFALGHERHLALVILGDGLASLAGTLMLVRVVGPIGAPVASLLSAFFISLPLLFKVYVRETSATPSSALRPITAWGLRFSIVAIPVSLLAALHPPVTFATAVGLAGVGLLTYVILELRLLIREPLVRYLPKKAALLLSRSIWTRVAAEGL